MADLDPVAFLRATPPFDALPAPDFERAATALEVVFAPAGHVFISRDGTPADHLFLIRKGLARFERDGETVQVVEPGEFFGFTSVLAGATPFTVVADEDVLAYRLPAAIVRAVSPTSICLGLGASLRTQVRGVPRSRSLPCESDAAVMVTSSPCDSQRIQSSKVPMW